jgi:hypothetical protein
MCRLVRTAETHIADLGASGLLPPSGAAAAVADAARGRGR